MSMPVTIVKVRNVWSDPGRAVWLGITAPDDIDWADAWLAIDLHGTVIGTRAFRTRAEALAAFPTEGIANAVTGI